MPGLFNIRFDTLSFWLGFLAATLFWWLLRKIQPSIPRAVERVRHLIQQSKRKSSDRLDDAMRRETLRRAQATHLAAATFPLDDILVQPLLIAPPPALVTPGQSTPNTIANQVIPYLPDWPEISAHFPVRLLHPAEALQNGARVAVIGQPGCGKTVLLASLASQCARRSALPGDLQEKTPILVHVIDLVLDAAEWRTDPLLPLIKAAGWQNSVLVQPQIPRYVRAVAAEGRLLVLVDGLDEIHPSELPAAAAWLTALAGAFPGIALIVAASPHYMDGLSTAGFLPLAVAGWDGQKKQQFLQQWTTAWNKHVQPALARTGAQPVDSRVLNLWLTSDNETLTPLEWTLKVWALYAGDLRGRGSIDAIDAYLLRILAEKVPIEAPARLAALLIARGKAALSYREMEQALSDLKVAAAPVEAEPAARGKKKQPQLSSGARMLDAMLDSGLLAAHSGDLLRFASPVFCGYFAAPSISAEDVALLASQPYWTLNLTAARYCAGKAEAEQIVQTMLYTNNAPLHAELLACARWLADAPENAPWRAAVLRKLVTLIQQNDLPFGLRGRLLGAFIAANDSATPLLLKQLMGSKVASVRQLAAIGCGALQQSRLLNDLMALLADPVPDVRFSACLALGAFDQPAAREALSAALAQGDEGLQQAAAEVLAYQPGRGYDLLKEALTSDNLLVRRAAVLGMANIHETWTTQLLEKTAVEDAQWVVRSAAAQAIENRQQTDPYLPAPLPPAANAAWLITYASKQGTGVPANAFPMELLLSALQDGTLEEKLAAMAYTRDSDDERVLMQLHALLQGPDPAASEAALYTLWHKAAAGQNVTPLQMYFSMPA